MNLECLHANGGESWLTLGQNTPVQLDEISGFNGPDYAFLQAAVAIGDLSQIKARTNALYQKLLALMTQLEKPRLVRVWNYIPQINAGEADFECYRQFCWGRAEALGDTELSAATGIGSQDGVLRVCLLSTALDSAGQGLQIRHLENPRQISAYNYPRQYGPRSPSFARATLIDPPYSSTSNAADRIGVLLLSGTASIVAHETLHKGDFQAQSKETARNIQTLLATLERPVEPLALRYYLRNPDQLAQAKDCWREHFGDWPLPAFYRADICRAELELEIEGVFSVPVS